MLGPEKLATMLAAAVLTLSALSAIGQQTSNAASNLAQDTRQEAGVVSSPIAPRTPAEMPPNPPKVTCDGNQLTISAQNSTLGAVLNAIRACSGAEIDLPDSARGERLFAELGPGPVRTVLADFLSSTDFNYVIKASPSDPQKVQTVVLNPRITDSAADVVAEVASDGNPSLNRRAWLKARENYTQSFTAAQDEPSQGADAASSIPAPVETAAAPTNSISPEAEPTNPVPVGSGVAPTAIGQIASVPTDSGAAQNQGKSTQEMISDMQRMFEQRKQMVQQQTATGH